MSSASSAEDEGASSEGCISAFVLTKEGAVGADLDYDWTSCCDSVYEG
jgi:hypothetical protein